MTPSATTASNDPCSDHSYELPLRRNLLLLLDLLDVLRFVAGVLLDRLGVVSCEGAGLELPGQTWGGGGGHADDDDAAAVAVERFIEARTRLWAPGAPPVTRAARYRRRRRADGEGAAAVCAICLAELEAAGEGEGGCETVAELGLCPHAFHAACIDAWAGAAEDATCPLCRAPLMLPTAWDADDGRQSLCHARPGD
ncbi:unnamed protein product [Urochloa decumbens]|uniref:RING-type domain-containing protein n=1 Tax=Urochloa decumbens TaxID=240449 RepID=A0ABC9D2K0_9POAL